MDFVEKAYRRDRCCASRMPAGEPEVDQRGHAIWPAAGSLDSVESFAPTGHLDAIVSLTWRGQTLRVEMGCAEKDAAHRECLPASQKRAVRCTSGPPQALPTR